VKQPLAYRNYADVANLVAANLWRLPRDVGLVVGVARSGLVPATIIALHLNVPVADVSAARLGSAFAIGRTRKNFVRRLPADAAVLVVDDSALTGDSIGEAVASVRECYQRVYSLVVFADPAASRHVDMYLDVCPSPRVFEWNVFHSSHLASCCVDIDGILCLDPTELENDDGPKYMQFLVGAKPLLIPTAPVGTLVTNRLERYRKPTEDWLARMGITYGNLEMLDLPSRQARLQLPDSAAHKADVYRRSFASMFIESDHAQAVRIARRSARPVLCWHCRALVEASARGRVQRSLAENIQLRRRQAAVLRSRLKQSVRGLST
jgi:uncharacterized HAD superfamily protein/adenine/guanine phosphoribosyltransferase-like PRPP-binding protein